MVLGKSKPLLKLFLLLIFLALLLLAFFTILLILFSIMVGDFSGLNVENLALLLVISILLVSPIGTLGLASILSEE